MCPEQISFKVSVRLLNFFFQNFPPKLKKQLKYLLLSHSVTNTVQGCKMHATDIPGHKSHEFSLEKSSFFED
jgi:hypothetical protein